MPHFGAIEGLYDRAFRGAQRALRRHHSLLRRRVCRMALPLDGRIDFAAPRLIAPVRGAPDGSATNRVPSATRSSNGTDFFVNRSFCRLRLGPVWTLYVVFRRGPLSTCCGWG